MAESPYKSVQKSELYAILILLSDFQESLNIVTDSHIETAEFIQDDSELTSLFFQLPQLIRNRSHSLYITHIRSHTGLPGPLAQGDNEIDQLLIERIKETLEFHKQIMLTASLKERAKGNVRQCHTCSLYNQIPLPSGTKLKGTKRNVIWQMDVFHFTKFGKLKCVHHTIDTY